MIVFDLDGTLADCSHRRHFIEKPENAKRVFTDLVETETGTILKLDYLYPDKSKWIPDWKSFYEACDEDEPIQPVIDIYKKIAESWDATSIRIWSGRCDSVRNKTQEWLIKSLSPISMRNWNKNVWEKCLKMRPAGDSTPDDELKERWLDEALAQGKKIEFVFDDRPKVIRMWRRRGIFVFDCNQDGREF
jgi:hypothetical protein